MIVVTGASRGIGRAIVRRFAAQGFDIVACARKPEGLQALKQEVEAEFGVQVHTFAADLSDKAQAQGFAAQVRALGAPVRVLVNNAGVFVPGQLHDEPDGILEQMIDTNLYSAYHVTRGLIGGMMERRLGHVFNIASTASFTAYTNGGSYAVAKHAMLGFSRCLREEMKPYGVKVTTLMPGATYTDSWAGVELPEERFCSAQDVAELVYGAFALSPSAVVEELVVRPLLGDIG